MPLYRMRLNDFGAAEADQIDERGEVVRSHDSADTPPAAPVAPARDEDMEDLILGLRGELEADGTEERANADAEPPEEVPPPLPAAAVPDPSPALAEVMEKLHDNNVEWAIERANRLEDAAELARMDAIEREHPKYAGGRPRVLRAIEARVKAIGGQL